MPQALPIPSSFILDASTTGLALLVGTPADAILVDKVESATNLTLEAGVSHQFQVNGSLKLQINSNFVLHGGGSFFPSTTASDLGIPAYPFGEVHSNEVHTDKVDFGDVQFHSPEAGIASVTTDGNTSAILEAAQVNLRNNQYVANSNDFSLLTNLRAEQLFVGGFDAKLKRVGVGELGVYNADNVTLGKFHADTLNVITGLGFGHTDHTSTTVNIKPSGNGIAVYDGNFASEQLGTVEASGYLGMMVTTGENDPVIDIRKYNDSFSVFSVTQRNGATLNVGVSRALTIGRDGIPNVSIGNSGGIPYISAGDGLSLNLSSRVSTANSHCFLIHNDEQPVGETPLLRIGWGHLSMLHSVVDIMDGGRCRYQDGYEFQSLQDGVWQTGIQQQSSSSGVKLGFFGGVPVVQPLAIPTADGTEAGNAASINAIKAVLESLSLTGV